MTTEGPPIPRKDVLPREAFDYTKFSLDKIAPYLPNWELEETKPGEEWKITKKVEGFGSLNIDVRTPKKRGYGPRIVSLLVCRTNPNAVESQSYHLHNWSGFRLDGKDDIVGGSTVTFVGQNKEDITLYNAVGVAGDINNSDFAAHFIVVPIKEA